MSMSALANVVTQALSVAQLGSAVWRTLEEAELALQAFSAAQGWSLSTRKSGKYHYKYKDAQGEERPGEIESYKGWICSKGHQRKINESHLCNDIPSLTDDSNLKPCDVINASGQLVAPPANAPRLLASTKTGCPVSVRVVMIKKAETGASWTEQDTPCAGYKLATPAQMLLPCHHNHCSNRSTNRNLTESVSQIPNEVREEVKSLVLASFPSYRICNFITNKHNLPPLMPTVWNSLIRTIKTELGIHDAGQDLKTLEGAQ